jgi:hypothetical protein
MHEIGTGQTRDISRRKGCQITFEGFFPDALDLLFGKRFKIVRCLCYEQGYEVMPERAKKVQTERRYNAGRKNHDPGSDYPLPEIELTALVHIPEFLEGEENENTKQEYTEIEVWRYQKRVAAQVKQNDSQNER